MEKLEASTAMLTILTHSQFTLPDEAADTYWMLQRWPLVLQDELEAAAERIRGYRGDFQQELMQDQQQLQADLQELQVTWQFCYMPAVLCCTCTVAPAVCNLLLHMAHHQSQFMSTSEPGRSAHAACIQCALVQLHC